MSSTKAKRVFITAVTLCSLVPLSTTMAATASAQQAKYQPDMVTALARSLGVGESEAVRRLDGEATARGRLEDLVGRGVRLDGAFFDAAGALTVNAADPGAAASARAAGLAVREGKRGEAALRRVQATLDRAAARQVPSGVTSWSVDVEHDVMRVEVADRARPGARAFLAEAARHGGAVVVVDAAAPVVPLAKVYPGSKMNLNGTDNYCSVGYGAKDSSGRQYLVTAGHCVTSGTKLHHNDDRFAVGSATRYKLGSTSVDMGVATIDSGDSIATEVGTWGALNSNLPVRGSSRATSGSSLCKSGATTGWTCGVVKNYNLSVTYTDRNGGPDTVVKGLASSTVCVMGGDSGGAYISGDQAQGVTSGGPIDQECTWNGGSESGKSSYFQPLDDVLSYYSLTLNLS